MRWIGLLLCATALAQTPHEIEVWGSELWIDTGLDLQPGDAIAISAEGSLNAGGQEVKPGGGKRGWLDMLRTYPVNDVGPWALIGRLGEGGRAFGVGETREMEAPLGGRLYLGINKTDTRAVTGRFLATVIFTRHAPAPVDLSSHVLPNITTAMIDRVPRRVQDAEGTVGDNTNFVIVGSEHQIVDALKAVGWLEVDRGNNNAVRAGIEAVLGRQAYLTIPMSELLLFGRVQDYGMAMGDPLMVVAERHHFRLWRAPFDADGHEVWIGAGTHDVGFDRDQRNGSLTHKIDPEVDKERDYIGASLQSSGKVAKLDYVMPSSPSQTAKTAHGQEFRSDGRLLVIYMIPENAIDSAKESIFFR